MDITEIQPFFEKGDQVRVSPRASELLAKLGEYELAGAEGIVLKSKISASGQPVYLLYLTNGNQRKVSQIHLEMA